MNSAIIYIDNKILSNPIHPLYFIFSKEIRSKFFVTSSFLIVDNKKLNIFTSLNKFVLKFIEKNMVKDYIFILNGQEKNRYDQDELDCLLAAEKVFFIGGSNNTLSVLKNTEFLNIEQKTIKKGTQDKFTYEDCLSVVYSDCLEQINKNLYVLSNNDLSYWYGIFNKKNITITQLPISLGANEFCFENFEFIGGLKSNSVDSVLNTLSINAFIDLLDNQIENLSKKPEQLKGINIVCFNPTYLFKDLVDRFVGMGCVHSDFPKEGFSGYIWMRPQEIWHLEYIKANKEHKEISKRYFEEGKKIINSLDLNYIKSKSVAIHHGTCYEPLYQFDYNLLAKSLYTVKKVIGVCEFDECYSPSKDIANKNNFKFIPIGYDSSLFKKNLIKDDLKDQNQTVHIGFVGRAYGTNDFDLLAKSKMAEPKGYRKGGDILEAIVNKLTILNVNFHLHILGQNWEHLVEYFDQVGIKYTYYARDKNITYTDYPLVYAKLDALLITARCEGGPVSAIEALSLGVPIISSNVGVVKFLKNNLEKGVYTFNYDKKWHVADISMAVNKIVDIYQDTIDYNDRVNIAKQVEVFTTDNWVSSIIDTALN